MAAQFDQSIPMIALGYYYGEELGRASVPAAASLAGQDSPGLRVSEWADIA